MSGIFSNPVARNGSTATTERSIELNPWWGLLASVAILGAAAIIDHEPPKVISTVRLIRNGGWVAIVRISSYGQPATSFSNVIGYGRGSTADGARRDAMRIASMYQKQGVRVSIDKPTYQREPYEF